MRGSGLQQGDPLLVRAGRGLVPTLRAAELRDQVHELTRDVRTVLNPQTGHLDVASLELTFTIRANEGVRGTVFCALGGCHHRGRATCPAALRTQA